MEIQFENVKADYQIGPIRSKCVLDSVNLSLKSGAFTAVIGHTGAGKSSLLKAMNGLLLPSNGYIRIGDTIVEHGTKNHVLKTIRKRVGMVFQFPESQLFAETVEKDICFGPLNFGVPLNEAKEIAKKVIIQVGLDKNILSKSPFNLSGGQKRRVAIAGILAVEPDILVLDEPGAGLDPRGKKEILSLISSLNKQRNITIVLVTHEMNDVAQYADDVVVMQKGKVVTHADVRTVFSNIEQLEKWSLVVPDARRIQLKIEDEIGMKLNKTCLTLEELTDAIMEVGL